MISPGTLEAAANIFLVDNVGGRKGWEIYKESIL